jgi:hypothetical protein
MSQQTACQTPGAIFSTHIQDRRVSLIVDLPISLGLTGPQAELLEANLHNAAELVLARYFA